MITGLYWAAMAACHSEGLPWTDPRDGTVYQPPKRFTRKKKPKAQKKRKLG